MAHESVLTQIRRWWQQEPPPSPTEWAAQFADPCLAELAAQSRTDLALADRQALVEELVQRYAQAPNDAQRAADVRYLFLTLLVTEPLLLEEEPFLRFLAEEIEAADFDRLEWTSPQEILTFSEGLYTFPFPNDTLAKPVRTHVRRLLRQALHQYEERGKQEKLFLLMRSIPASIVQGDPELRRLRHLAHSYEIRRVQRNRRWLYLYLIVQVLMVLVIFPLLFKYAENGEIQRLVEDTADVELGDEGYRLFSYSEAVYWSVITAGSIGYGDITPLTNTGRIIAALLGTIGVITAGVIAGLVLQWVTPRALDL